MDSLNRLHTDLLTQGAGIAIEDAYNLYDSLKFHIVNATSRDPRNAIANALITFNDKRYNDVKLLLPLLVQLLLLTTIMVYYLNYLADHISMIFEILHEHYSLLYILRFE